MTEALSFPFLAPLREIPGLRVDLIVRIPELSVDGERDEVLARLRPAHELRVGESFGCRRWWRAEQVHGCLVAEVPATGLVMAGDGLPVVEGVDGLVTAAPGEVLGIYVADCGVIWLADRVSGAIGLLHSGKKGSELGILEEAVKLMARRFGTRAEDLVGVLGPCIRPPHYEVDFAADIVRQASAMGIREFHDCGIDTAADLDCYYSYRMEKGRTGRLLALIMREERGALGHGD